MAHLAASFDGPDETELRRLCGEATFSRADLLQRAGHVLDPTINGSTLRGTVRGTWRRVDQVAVSGSGRLTLECTCNASGLCTHVAALLLHWVRDQSSFVEVREIRGSVEGPAAGPAPVGETPAAEVARGLEGDTTPHLRQIARARGLRASARTKSDLIEALAPLLADPSDIDEALARLNDDGRLTLDAVQLAEAAGQPTRESVGTAYHALDGAGDANVDALVDLGLVMAATGAHYAYSRYYRVPRAVAARLPVLRNLARPIDSNLANSQKPSAASPAGPHLDMAEFLLVVALQLGRGRFRLRRLPALERQLARSELGGWRIDPSEPEGDAIPEASLGRHREVRLCPMPSLATDEDLERLAALTGQKVAAVAFALELLAELGVLWGSDRLFVQEERVRSILDQAPDARLAELSRAWLGMRYRPELEMVAGKGGPLQLHYNLASYGGLPPLLSQVDAVRRLVAVAVARMAPGVWYDFWSLVTKLLQLAPRLLSPQLPSVRQDSFSITERGQQGDEASGGKTVAPEQLPGALVWSVLGGALRWLDMVEVTVRDGRTPAFRVRPEARVLVGREVAVIRAGKQATLEVSPDLSILVRAGIPDAEIHALLGQAGVLADASTDGLRYQLMAERVNGLFEEGITGPELVRALADRSEAALPEAARSILERWWAGYGTLRLYDDLSLIELADDYLLPELLATTSLRSSLIHAFSPRLIAVDTRAVDGLVAELTRLGHGPRVLEGP